MYNFNLGFDSYSGYSYILLKDLQEYIHDELKDCKYYAVLAAKAPTPRAKELLMEFSNDERMHARYFMNAYYMLTGQCYTPPVVEEPQVPDFCEALKVRIMAETHDYKKYGEQYLKAPNPYLKDLFFMARTVEAQHAMRMPILLSEGNC